MTTEKDCKVNNGPFQGFLQPWLTHIQIKCVYQHGWDPQVPHDLRSGQVYSAIVVSPPPCKLPHSPDTVALQKSLSIISETFSLNFPQISGALFFCQTALFMA